MNKSNLDIIIKNYIEKFDLMNDPEHDETYKWVAVQSFQDKWDIEAEDFSSMFREAVTASYNLISNSKVQPTGGIVALAKIENETVREMFRRLYSDDGGDIIVRQSRIDNFVSQANIMCEKYFPGSWKYKQEPRSAIIYLALRYPDDNFMYKATEAQAFAKGVEYGNGIGSGQSFKLNNYYGMCEQLVKAIKESPELLDGNKKRLNNTTWADSNYHILAYDIIYGAKNYNLYNNVAITKNDKKSTPEKEQQIQIDESQTKIQKLRSELEAIIEEKTRMRRISLSGVIVQHKKFGKGEIINQNGDTIVVRFPLGDKKLGLPDAFVNGCMTTARAGTKEHFEHLTEVLIEEKRLEIELQVLEYRLHL